MPGLRSRAFAPCLGLLWLTDCARPAPGGHFVSETEPTTGREYDVYVPPASGADRPRPLVVVLHGYGRDARWQFDYWNVRRSADAKGFLVALPRGTPDAEGKRFWNADAACCNFGGLPVDDVAFLRNLIEDVGRRHRVDPRRIFVTGHSNGGFMAHRAGCALADVVAGVASVVGAAPSDAATCEPSEAVFALEVHGTNDAVVRYEGGHTLDRAELPPHPSAPDSAALWARKNGCRQGPVTAPERLDLVADVPGAETERAAYGGCAAGGGAELWTIRGGVHDPVFATPWFDRVYDALAAHPKGGGT